MSHTPAFAEATGSGPVEGKRVSRRSPDREAHRDEGGLELRRGSAETEGATGFARGAPLI